MTTVLCNAGPLIALGKLNRLELLAELTPLSPHGSPLKRSASSS